MPQDPVAALGISGFSAALRRGEVTSEAAVKAYLARIDALDPLLSSYEQVDADGALATARALDSLLACGVDLGPLMGLPVSVKDLFLINGFTPHAGTNLPIQERLGTEEGRFIRVLKEAGCVILGTTRMVEFALGITGHSNSRGTPWNPWDDQHHYLPGGSSSGAAVALSAGLCALSIGTDTGGSVRVPAAMCGLFGLKTTAGLWPNDGTFPLEPNTDSIGLLTRSAQDAAIVFECLNERLNPASPSGRPSGDLARLSVGIPKYYFLDDLTTDMQTVFEQNLNRIKAAGAKLKSTVIPHVDGRERYFPMAMSANLLAWLGEENFLHYREKIDPIIRVRIEAGLSIKAHDYLALARERQQHIKDVHAVFDKVDVLISPTTQGPSRRVAELGDLNVAMQAAMGMTRNTQPANYFDWCAVTLPMGISKEGLPLGLQLNARGYDEARLLQVAMAVEALFDPPTQPKPFRGLSLR